MMWRKCLIVGVVFVAFGMIFLTQSTWATDAESFVAMSEDESVTARTWKDYTGKAGPVGPLVPCNVDCLTGKWGVLMGTMDESGEFCWASFNVVIGSGGIVEKGVYKDCDGKTSKIIGGRFTMSPGCTVKGKIETSSGALYAPGGHISGNSLVLGVARRPANRYERDEAERMLDYHHEDIKGVLLRIRRELTALASQGEEIVHWYWKKVDTTTDTITRAEP